MAGIRSYFHKNDKGKREEEKKELEERQEKLLEELDKLRSEGKDRRDKRVQKLEKDMCKTLQIPPESWISIDKSLEEMISKFELNLIIGGGVQVRETLSDHKLLQTASGGLALQGVLLTKKLEDRLKDRNQLLKTPDTIFKTQEPHSKDIIEHFISTCQENNYNVFLDVLGVNTALLETVPVEDVTISAGIGASAKLEHEHTKERYSSTVKYSVTSVAKYSFSKKDLKLHDDAKEDLKRVLKLLKLHGKDSANVEEECNNFFREYGSHVNKGPFIFGGYYYWKCSSKGFSLEEEETVRTMQSSALSATAGVSFAGLGVSTEMSMEEIKGSYKGKCSKNTMVNTHLVVIKNGGPLEAKNLSQWETGLMAYNSTWLLIDRGTKLVSVWDIIRENHKELGEIREVLRIAWEKMTGLKSEMDLLTVLSYNSEDVLRDLNMWNKENLTPRQIVDILQHLLNVKRDIIEKTGNPSFWITEYLLQSSLQEFLVSVVNSQHVEHIKFVMQQLVEEEDLKQLDTRVFRDIELVSEWLYNPNVVPEYSTIQNDITDFHSFENFLGKIIENARLSQLTGSEPLLQKPNVSDEILSTVTKGIHYLRSNYHQTYDDVLINILVDRFQSSKYNNLNPIILNDLESLHKSFFEERKKFDQVVEKKQPLQLQVYLFNLAVDLSPESILNQLLQQIKQMMKVLQPPLEMELDISLPISSAQEFKRSLQRLMSTSERDPHQFSPSDNCLKEALKTATSQCNPPDHDMNESVKNSRIQNLFKKSGFCEFYPKKLTLQDAQCIQTKPLKLSLNKIPLTNLKQLPYLILHKLMSYDYLCRSELTYHKDEYRSTSAENWGDYDDQSDSSHYRGDYDDQSDSSDYQSANSDVESDTPDGIHPVDGLLALLLCSDDFLCQDLLSRLAKCQLAVPFILPDPFTKKLTLPLWGMRSIIKEWKCVVGDSKVVERTHSLVDYKMPIVSFIRFGKYQKNAKSKSKILNEVISESHYDHYFHRDCPGAQYNLLLGEGLVDMCWYLPSGKPEDTFPDAVTFLNLHGDARNYPKQSRFLSQISSMCLVLLTEEDLEFEGETLDILKKFSSPPGSIMVLNDVEKKPETLMDKISKLYVIKLSTRSMSQTKSAIQDRINMMLKSQKEFRTIRSCCNTGVEGIFVDESSDSYRQGLSYANNLKGIITSHRDIKISLKEDLLPLQGKCLWQAWAAQDKEVNRQLLRGNKKVAAYTAEINSKKGTIRREQLESVKPLSPLTYTFIETLLKLGGPMNKIVRNFFLQCLKLQLNESSRKNLSEFLLLYQSTRSELAKLSTSECEVRDESLIEEYKKKLIYLQDIITNGTIGLEHLFRELGQVYEATIQSSEYEEDISRLPKAAAELLIEGYSLEIMDGDAAHVPQKWITAVIAEVVKMLNNPNVYVMSVLGVQSTGKSTMLNTAFGLQFNVSAGRCTRGAFLQLIPLDEELRKQTKFSYVLVVDTEGLRAPELDPLKTQKHDNELATFVIGLANVTLINIYGEVAGDMDDILQTSVHAFLRMNQVEYNPSCRFVHQNAGANIKSEVGRANFTEKLNKFTVDAAREEKCEGRYKSFNDVIKYDDQKDVHFFPGLWKGDPPMAPVNQGYSNSAQMLKYGLTELLCEIDGRVGSLSLSSFHVKVNDLWKALLKEKFVFSFKNTLEITAYNSLETEYSKLEWTFQEGMLSWEHKTGNDITTADVKTDPNLVQNRCKELALYVSDKYQSLKEKMDEIFNGQQSEILVQWKGKFETRLQNLSKELEHHATQHCRKLGRSKVAISKIEEDRKKYIDIMTGKVHEYIANLKQEREKLHQNLEKRKLEPAQLKKLFKKKMFTPETLAKYQEKKIITEKQANNIQHYIEQCGGQVTESVLKGIILSKLVTDQMLEILKVGRKTETEEELKVQFDAHWSELVSNLPIAITEDINVELEVENKLIDFVKSQQGYDGQLIAELLGDQRSLRERGKYLVLDVVECVHYNRSTMLGRLKQCFKTSETCMKEAETITTTVFDKANQYLKRTTEKDSDFNTAFTQDLLRQLDEEITKHVETIQSHFTFTHKYRFHVFITACGHAIPYFETMSENYKNRNDPRHYLERHEKGPLFTKFKNEYYQTEAEEAIANNICAQFEEPIKAQIKQILGIKMVGQMKYSNQQHFSSKMALKVKILTDLHDKDDFESYMFYVTHVKISTNKWIKKYTLEYCSSKDSGSTGTRFQVTTKEEVSRLVLVVGNIMNEMKGTDAEECLSGFCNDARLRSELGVKLCSEDLLTGYDSLKLNLENFKGKIRDGLLELKKKLHDSFNSTSYKRDVANWTDKPHELLGKLIGCSEQCPFCNEQCELLDPNHVNSGIKHRTKIHRSSCLRGYRWDTTQVMITDFCPSLVSGKSSFKCADTGEKWHPYLEYQKIYPHWSIEPDVTAGDSLYWMMFVAKYKDAIADRFKAKPPDVPSEWSYIKWEDVLENLKKQYNH